MASLDEFVNSTAWLMKVSGAQRGRSRHAAPPTDAHGARLVGAPSPPPRSLTPPRPLAMDLHDMPRHRPLAFDKMESLIKEMQDPETGVPVRSQKLFLSTIPSAFMGYDLVEWLMNKFDLDESTNVEAINLANLLCQYGYFFPVNDSKNLVLKDDSSLYRFQSPYYWPWQAPRVAGSGSSAPTLGPDNVEYAIYLVKRTLRNKQKHGLEEYEVVALDNLKKNLAAKWEFVTMQAEEQVRLAKERKKGDKIVSDSQERAYWRVARPPPGMMSILEPCPVPLRNRNTKRYGTMEYLTQEIEMLKESLERTRVKTSVAVEALITYSETFAPYDPWMTPPQPSNPWATDDTLFWQINSPLVEVPSEKRVQRWAISIEELVSDPTGLQEFTAFLRKEYSHENIRFWQEVQELRHTSVKALPTKLDEIYQEFLAPGAPCEINIDGATGERARERIRSGSRFALDDAADHVYNLLLKKDCYPRFIRSDHYQRLLQEGKNVLQKKKFFNFGGGGQVKKKPCAGGGGGGAGGSTGSGTSTGTAGLRGRRGSERSLSGSAHELAHCGTGTGAAASTGTGTGTAPARSDVTAPSARPGPSACTQPKRAPHSHSQTNLTDISREPDEGSEAARWGETAGDAVYGGATRRQDSGSSSSELSERRRLPQQSTLDGGLRGAPPPLRRLSAVEPRHMAPLLPVVAVLTAPAVTPVTAPAVTAPAVTPVTRPAPTISVSTPDDDLTEQTDPPSSVFASGDVTPSDPLQVTSDSECSSRDRTLSRQTSTCNDIVISPASCKHTSSAIADLPEGYVDRSVLKTADGDIKPSAFSIAAEAEIIAEKPSVASAVPKLSVSPQTIVTAVGSIATQPVTVVMEERNVEKTPTVVTTDHSVATQAPTTVAAKHSSDGIVTLKASTSEASEHSVAAPELAAPQYDASKAPRRSLTPPAINTVAPLAQGEDSCAEDEPLSAIDFVPAVTIAAVSAPAVTPAAVSAPTVTTAAVSAPTVTPAAVSAPTVTPAAASASEVTPVAVPAVTSASTGDRRNDVCPWEDE